MSTQEIGALPIAAEAYFAARSIELQMKLPILTEVMLLFHLVFRHSGALAGFIAASLPPEFLSARSDFAAWTGSRKVEKS